MWQEIIMLLFWNTVVVYGDLLHHLLDVIYGDLLHHLLDDLEIICINNVSHTLHMKLELDFKKRKQKKAITLYIHDSFCFVMKPILILYLLLLLINSNINFGQIYKFAKFRKVNNEILMLQLFPQVQKADFFFCCIDISYYTCIWEKNIAYLHFSMASSGT